MIYISESIPEILSIWSELMFESLVKFFMLLWKTSNQKKICQKFDIDKAITDFLSKVIFSKQFRFYHSDNILIKIIFIINQIKIKNNVLDRWLWLQLENQKQSLKVNIINFSDTNYV